MIFEYFDHDLAGMLAHPNLKFEVQHIKCIMQQALRGLDYLHSQGVIHRDVKGKRHARYGAAYSSLAVSTDLLFQ